MPAPARELRNGVEITRVRSTSFGRGSHIGRLADYATFYVQVLRTLLTGRRRAGVVVLTTPPLLEFVAWLARRLRGQRYAVWSMDLHPDAEIAAGMLAPRGLLARVLLGLNKLGYRGADFLVDLGPYMKRLLTAKGVPAERTATVHMWSSGDEIEPTPRDRNPLAASLGLADRFVVMYSGNAGIVHEFDPILEAMRRLRDDARIHFLFVGDGPQRSRIERYAAEHRIENFGYHDYFARDQLRHSLSMADVHLISLRRPFVGISVPGKLYGIMAAGRPALFVGPAKCESADAIRDGQCGVVVDVDSSDAAGEIVSTLRRWSADSSEPRAMGERGRAVFLEQYERDRNCAAFGDVVARVWGAPVPAALPAGVGAFTSAAGGS